MAAEGLPKRGAPLNTIRPGPGALLGGALGCSSELPGGDFRIDFQNVHIPTVPVA